MFKLKDRIRSGRTGGGKSGEMYHEPTLVVQVSKETRQATENDVKLGRASNVGQDLAVSFSAVTRLWNMGCLPNTSGYGLLFLDEGMVGVLVLDPDYAPLTYSENGNLMVSQIPVDDVFVLQTTETSEYHLKQWGTEHAKEFSEMLNIPRGKKAAIPMEEQEVPSDFVDSEGNPIRGRFWIGSVN